LNVITWFVADSLTINVPVVFMAWYVMVLRRATSLLGALEGVGPKKSRFSGPTPSNAPSNATLGVLWQCTVRNKDFAVGVSVFSIFQE
jgi:hypothetical protein